jgi:hypothetical protein
MLGNMSKLKNWMIGNMFKRIGKYIVHEGIVYGYEANKSAFTGESSLHVVYNNPDSIYLYFKNKETQDLNIINVKLKDCLFIYEDEFEKYPEYFI